MYELSDLLISVAGCSATFIAIVGGFIASKLIALSTEREEILTRLHEVEEEIRFKQKKVSDAKESLDEDDALDFIRENIDGVILAHSLDKVYKAEERPTLTKEEIYPYWDRATVICRRLYDIMVQVDDDENDDGVPNILAKEIQKNFEYKVCEYAARRIKRLQLEQSRKSSPFSFNIPAVGDYYLDNLPAITGTWYQRTRDEMYEVNASIEWLEVQKGQLIARKNALKKPKGMKSGLVVFGLFTLFGILIPLCFVPCYTNTYLHYLAIKYSIIGTFAVGLLAVFIYLISLFKWKEEH